MAGRLALRAEVLGRLDDPGAEDLEPEAVDGHAGGQRMVGGDQPLRQPQAVDRRARRQRRQERGHGPADLLALLVVLAPLEHERRLGIAGLLTEDQRRGDLLFELLSASSRPRPAWLAGARRSAPVLEYACSRK